jgi:hypothetical protein
VVDASASVDLHWPSDSLVQPVKAVVVLMVAVYEPQLHAVLQEDLSDFSWKM